MPWTAVLVAHLIFKISNDNRSEADQRKNTLPVRLVSGLEISEKVLYPASGNADSTQKRSDGRLVLWNRPLDDPPDTVFQDLNQSSDSMCDPEGLDAVVEQL